MPAPTEKARRGLHAIAVIVETLRTSIGEVDDPAEEAEIVAALAWIRGLKPPRSYSRRIR
jgi:hypothetical protein